jgi:hydrogenase maturation protease
MIVNKRTSIARLGIVGIGNTLAGDDGAGALVVRGLKRIHGFRRDILFHELKGDLFEIADLCACMKKIIFCDAMAGTPPGTITVLNDSPARPMAPSFHQADIASVMRCLKNLKIAAPFPEWEIWGIVIDQPRFFSRRLTLPVRQAVRECVERISARIDAF